MKITANILTEVSRCFPQFLQENAGTIRKYLQIHSVIGTMTDERARIWKEAVWPNRGSVQAFVWREQEKPREISIMRAIFQAEIRTEPLPNMSPVLLLHYLRR
jgi:hypothetical protein